MWQAYGESYFKNVEEMKPRRISQKVPVVSDNVTTTEELKKSDKDSKLEKKN